MSKPSVYAHCGIVVETGEAPLLIRWSDAATWITVTAGGGEALNQGLAPQVLRPGKKYTLVTAITILKNRYQPTFVEVVVQSSYRGICGQPYTDEEVQTYDLEKRRFVRRELRSENRGPR